MKPIPKAAMSVVKEIREKVKRPKAMPKLRGEGLDASLRWLRTDKRTVYVPGHTWTTQTCPMGMLPDARINVPSDSCDFSRKSKLSDRAICSFWKWFDGLTESDAAEAMDAIWPSQGES